MDRAVEATVLAALQPASIHAALEALEQGTSQQDMQRQALVLALDKARYEAQRASRQYDLADPENRAALEQRHVPLREEQRQQLLSLGQDLSAVWHHAAAPEALKKRILRTVLHEIVIDSPPQSSEYLLRLHWQGGVHTELRVARNTAGKHGRATDRDVIEVIRELSKVHRDFTIAATLNRLGYRTGTGKTWRAHSVACVRYQYRLPNFAKGYDWLTLSQAAQQLGVSATVLKRCIAQGTLPARQVVPQAPWIIQRTDLALPAVQAAVQGVRTGRRPPGLRPGPAAPPAGAAPPATVPVEPRSPKLGAGVP